MGFVRKKRRKEIGWQAERDGERWEHTVAHGPECIKIGHHVRPQVRQPRRPLVAAAQRLADNHIGVFRPAIITDEEALVLIWGCHLVYGRSALHRGIDRQVSNIVLVELERELLPER